MSKVWDLKKAGPELVQLISRSKICPVLPVPCKCKVELCKFLSVQKYAWTDGNGSQVTKSLTFTNLEIGMFCTVQEASHMFSYLAHFIVYIKVAILAKTILCKTPHSVTKERAMSHSFPSFHGLRMEHLGP